MRSIKKTVLLSAVLASLPVAAAAEGTYSVSAGADFSQGDYGTGITSEIWSLPVGVSYSGERFSWSVSVPYVMVTAPEGFVVVSGGGAGLQLNAPESGTEMGSGPMGSDTTGTTNTTSTGGTDTTTTGGTDTTTTGGTGAGGPITGVASGSDQTRMVSGIGDVMASLSMPLVQEGDLLPWFALTGRVKFATADPDEGLGTGENDYAAQVEWAKGPVNGYVGQKWLGDTPTTDFRDPVYGAVGVTYLGDDGGDLGLEFYAEQAALDGVKSRRELTLYGSFLLDANLRLQGYMLKGLSDGSPDVGAGLAVTYSL